MIPDIHIMDSYTTLNITAWDTKYTIKQKKIRTIFPLQKNMTISGISVETIDAIGISLTNIIIRYFQKRLDPNQNYSNKKY